MIRWGTSHFETKAAAVRYYRPYHYGTEEKLEAAVEYKLSNGEIHIGEPVVRPGEVSGLDEDRRYWIETAGPEIPFPGI